MIVATAPVAKVMRALAMSGVSLTTATPLALIFEDNSVHWCWPLAGAFVYLVIGGSLLGVSAWHYLLRHGEVTRVTSLIYLTPVFAIIPEFFLFNVAPSPVSWIGIVITCAGVAMAAWQTPKKSN